MTERQAQLAALAAEHRDMILEAERWLWAHPQTGYTEWEAHGYMAGRFEAMGYTLTMAGNIPGFYTDVETGRPGPKLAIFAEMDALDIAGHPESVNGMTHSCGHHAQMAAMLGIAAALKNPAALEGMCGSIRLVVVPAEEMIQLSFREQLRKDGVIRFLGGKVEFMARGMLDGVDLALMVHAMSGPLGEKYDFDCQEGLNGCIAKVMKYKGKSSHAGAAPHEGVNAQYAAMLGLQACNDLRETFRDTDSVRFHPIMLGAKCAVNVIPDEMSIESFVRGRTSETIRRENEKVNRALTGAALAMGAQLELHDRPGYSPEYHDPAYMQLIERCCADLVGKERVSFRYHDWDTGSSDFGDVTTIMPGIQFSAAGTIGTAHGIDYYVNDPERLCLNSAKIQLLVADALLSDGAAAARELVANYKPVYSSIAEYIAAMEQLTLDKEAVIYAEDGTATVDFLNR